MHSVYSALLFSLSSHCLSSKWSERATPLNDSLVLYALIFFSSLLSAIGSICNRFVFDRIGSIIHSSKLLFVCRVKSFDYSLFIIIISSWNWFEGRFLIFFLLLLLIIPMMTFIIVQECYSILLLFFFFYSRSNSFLLFLRSNKTETIRSKRKEEKKKGKGHTIVNWKEKIWQI